MLPQPSVDNLVCIIGSKCSGERSAAHTLHFHAYLCLLRLEAHVRLGSLLVLILADVGHTCSAAKVFSKLVSPTELVWNSLISGLIKSGKWRQAFSVHENMQQQSLPLSGSSGVALLRICAQVKDIERGCRLHSDIARQGLLDQNLFVGNTLIDMYVKFGSLNKAQEVFNKLSIHDVTTWNALIAGYAQYEHGEQVLHCLESMHSEGISPNSFTFTASLKACGTIRSADKGRELHAEIVRKGALDGDLVLNTTLMDMYARCGLLENAQEVFDDLPVRDMVVWTALIAGYAQHERGAEALICFEQMQVDGFLPNAMTFSSILKASGNVGAPFKGEEIHVKVERQGLLHNESVLATGLVDMYAKCGVLAKAEDVFDKLETRDIISWNSLITGYALLGEIENLLHTVKRMGEESIKPDPITFTGIFNACSHGGLVDEGQAYFEVMSKGYGIAPTLEHYICMVDIFGRAGQLDKALAMMKKTPIHPYIAMWRAILGACRKWGDVEIGRWAFEQAVKLDEKEAATYVGMYNIYAEAGRQGYEGLKLEPVEHVSALLSSAFV